MRRTIIGLLLVLTILAAILILTRSRDERVSEEKLVRLQSFLSTYIAGHITLDYLRQKVPLTASVVDIRITGIIKSKTEQDYVYLIRGTVTYTRKGPSHWRDREGNEVTIEQDKNIERRFSCGVLEDRYLGTFFIDDRNRLILYADNTG